MRLGWDDLLMPPALMIAFFLLGWPYARSVNGGKPLTSTQRGMLVYGCWMCWAWAIWLCWLERFTLLTGCGWHR